MFPSMLSIVDIVANPPDFTGTLGPHLHWMLCQHSQVIGFFQISEEKNYLLLLLFVWSKFTLKPIYQFQNTSKAHGRSPREEEGFYKAKIKKNRLLSSIKFYSLKMKSLNVAAHRFFPPKQ